MNLYCQKIIYAVLIITMIAIRPTHADGPSVKEYLSDYAGRGAKLVKPGKTVISGRRIACGHRPTIYDPAFIDYGGAYPGFVILNPKKLKGLSPAVKLYIFAHECGHQFRGADEEAADCYAVQRGRREGWLSQKGLEQVCKFMLPHAASTHHPPGPERCRQMRKCYKNAIRKKKAERKD